MGNLFTSIKIKQLHTLRILYNKSVRRKEERAVGRPGAGEEKGGARPQAEHRLRGGEGGEAEDRARAVSTSSYSICFK